MTDGTSTCYDGCSHRHLAWDLQNAPNPSPGEIRPLHGKCLRCGKRHTRSIFGEDGMETDEIATVAQQAREEYIGHGTPEGRCLALSAAIVSALLDASVPADIREASVYTIDAPHWCVVADGRHLHNTPDDFVVIDASIDQFKDELASSIPPSKTVPETLVDVIAASPWYESVKYPAHGGAGRPCLLSHC